MIGGGRARYQAIAIAANFGANFGGRRERPNRHRSERLVEAGINHARVMLAQATPNVTV
jgi:hypothetical protein